MITVNRITLDYEETLQSFVEQDGNNVNTDDDKYIMSKHAPSQRLLNLLLGLTTLQISITLLAISSNS